MDSSHPKVSVCLPVFNGQAFLRDALESLIQQTMSDFEVIIGDDGSTDGSYELCLRCAEKDSRFKVTRNSERLGLFKNYNACISKATGRFIKLFAQDDYCKPTMFQKMVQALESHGSVGVVGCAKRWIDEHGQTIQPKTAKEKKQVSVFEQDTLVPGREAIRETLHSISNWLGEPSTIMFRKELADSGFDIRYRQAGDLDYWLRILDGDKDYYFLSEALCDFRLHSMAMSARNARSLVAQLDWYLLAGKFAKYLGQMEPPQTQEQFGRRLSARLVRSFGPQLNALEEDQRKSTTTATTAAPTQTNVNHNFFSDVVDPEHMLELFSGWSGVANQACGIDDMTEYSADTERYLAFAFCMLREAIHAAKEREQAQHALNSAEEKFDQREAELQAKVKELENEVAKLRHSVSEMDHSLSWKVTAPLRSAKKLLS
jgi:glycosyltransferase involved in cell wall biosynthesis